MVRRHRRSVAALPIVGLLLLVAAFGAPAEARQTPPTPEPVPTPAARAAPPAKAAPLAMVPAWTTTLPASAAGPALADEARLFVPVRGGNLVAISQADGAFIWTVAAASEPMPVVGGGLVFIVDEGALEALDAATGAARWQRPLPDPAGARLAFHDGRLLIVTLTGQATLVQAADGGVVWAQSLGARAIAPPAFDGQHVIVLLERHRVTVLDLATGRPAWSVTLPGPGTLAVPSGDRIFVGCEDRCLYALESRTGRTRWRWCGGGAPIGSVVVDGSRVFYASLDNVLRALQRGNGHQRWKQNLPMRPTGGPFLAGDLIMVPGQAAAMPAFRRADGTAAGGVELPSEPVAPAVRLPASADAPVRVVVALYDSRLQLLVPGSPPTPAKSPVDRDPGPPRLSPRPASR